ncbi:MAG: hypothetical protein EKK41_16490, partial [Hyphomicrobiales bacterium]
MTRAFLASDRAAASAARDWDRVARAHGWQRWQRRVPPALALVCAALFLTTALAAATAGAAEPARPARIVSLDLCADQILIDLVARRRIAAVTHLAADPSVSAIAEKARGYPVTRGAAEDVLQHDPDLVLAGQFGVSSTVSLLQRVGRNVVVVPLAS